MGLHPFYWFIFYYQIAPDGAVLILLIPIRVAPNGAFRFHNNNIRRFNYSRIAVNR